MAAPKSIKRLRQELELTQNEFAKKLGITQTTVSLWENGFQTPSVVSAHKMIKLGKEKKIKISLNDIFPEED